MNLLNKDTFVTFGVTALAICLIAVFWLRTGNTTSLEAPLMTASSTPELTDCQLYYRDVFSKAPEFGTFDEYKVTDTYTGPVAAVSENSHAVAKRFYSYHKAALDKGVTFGGRYTISDWAFTGWGQMFAVVDVETGEVFPFPYVVDWEFDYRPDSNLIIVNPKYMVPEFDKLGADADVSCDVKWFDDMKTYYFVFEDNAFRLLGPEDTSGLQTSSWLEN